MIFVRNLLRNKARSVMTLLGAAIGIAVYVSITTIAGNLQRETREVLSGYDTDITIQSRQAATPLVSRIQPEDIDGLRSMFGDDLFPIVAGSLREQWNPYALVLGSTPLLLSSFGLTEGKHPVSPGNDVMIGILLARSLNLGVGGTISLGGRNYRIVGIFSAGSRLIDGAVVADLSEAQRLLGKERQINLAMVRVKNKVNNQQLVQTINYRFPQLKAQSSADFVGNIRLFRTVETFARAVVIISFLAACLVVMNTLLMAVSERTAELGILMAVGWRPVLVLRMLFTESLSLCLCGAIAGNGLALIILQSLNRSKTIGFGWIPVNVSFGTVASSFLIAVALALITLIWPAMVVYRLSPLEALRHE